MTTRKCTCRHDERSHSGLEPRECLMQSCKCGSYQHVLGTVPAPNVSGDKCKSCSHVRAAHNAAIKPYMCLYCACSGFSESTDSGAQAQVDWENFLEDLQSDCAGGIDASQARIIWSIGFNAYFRAVNFHITKVAIHN